MANIRTGSIVSDIRGKVGDEIYSRNGGGAYVKAFTSPVQPNTTAQLDRRAQITEAVGDWQALTDAERQQWNVIAALASPSQKLGATKRRSGYNEFVSRKINLLNYTDTSDPVPVNTWKNATMVFNFAALENISGWVLRSNITRSPSDTDMALYAWASDVVSPGITSPNAVSYRFLGRNAFNNGYSNWTSDWTSVYGALAPSVGDKIFMKLRVVLRRHRNADGDLIGAAGQWLTPFAYQTAVAVIP